jgi:hypothetical protein
MFSCVVPFDEKKYSTVRFEVGPRATPASAQLGEENSKRPIEPVPNASAHSHDAPHSAETGQPLDSKPALRLDSRLAIRCGFPAGSLLGHVFRLNLPPRETVALPMHGS